jgi:hypothetical protein
MTYFQQPKIKQWGWVILFGMLCFAAGNHFKTEDALAGQAKYYKAAEVTHVKVVASKVATGVRAEDAKAVGVPVVVLKATVDAGKAKTTD